jgi:NADPH-dependent 2,4-dienoyl-CoA reductase/sulfur reductase-like enzyme
MCHEDRRGRRDLDLGHGSSPVTQQASERPMLVVVGAGPAGMAAAAAALDTGADVTLVDSSARLGGQLYRQPAGDVSTSASPAAGPCLPERFRQLSRESRLTYLPETTVWLAEREGAGFRLWLDRPDGPRSTFGVAVVLATGASELVVPFPGWDLPGVTTAGAAQALRKAYGLTIGDRVVVAGSGPFLLPVSASLAEGGATVLAVVEAAAAPWLARHLLGGLAHAGKAAEAARYLRVLRRAGVRLMTSSAVVRVEGDGAVERVVVSRLREDGRPIAATGESFRADAVCVSFGFVPRIELARQLGVAEIRRGSPPVSVLACDRTMAGSVPGVFVAGETTGIGGGAVAEIEGAIAGRSAARWLSRRASLPVRPGWRRLVADAMLSVRLAHARHLAGVLAGAFPERPGWMSIADDDTIVCRCEDVTFGEIRHAVEAGATTVAAARGLTRCGMGYCQGRTCGRSLEMAVSTWSGHTLEEVGDLSSRPIAMPVALGLVADAGQAQIVQCDESHPRTG